MKTTLYQYLESSYPALLVFAPAIGSELALRYRQQFEKLAPKIEATENGKTMLVNHYPAGWLEAQPIEEIFESWKARYLSKSLS